MSEPYSLYTFDVFDTLLTRVWLRPTDVFLHMERLQAGAYADWSERRRAAESRVRSTCPDGEVTLEQIYEELARDLGWSAQEAQQALLLELHCESLASRPIAPLVDRFNRLAGAAIPVACISDFYASREFVGRLLAQSGVKVSLDRVFVSSEEQLTKRTGALFERVRKVYELPAAQICHTGDHPISDVAKAQEAGFAVQAFFESLPTPTELTLASWGQTTSERLLASAIAGAARQARLSRELDAPASAIAGAGRQACTGRELGGRPEVLWSIATGVAGPLLFGYVYWLLHEARARGIHRLYFLARDGQILLRIAQDMARALKFDLDLRYLHASRRAWFLPSVGRGSNEERAAAILTEESVAIADVLRNLGISADAARPSLLAAGFDEATWSQMLPSARLRPVLSQPPFDALIADRARTEQALCLEYLTDQGVLDAVPKAIVDVGWKGRLQTALARMLREAGADAPTGFYVGLRERPDPVMSGESRTYFEGPDSLTLNPSLVELFSAADHGTTLGYERAPSGRAQPVLADAPRASIEWGLATLQDGICAFSASLLSSLPLLDEQPQAVSLGLRKSALASVGRVVRRPSPAEADVLGSFPHAAGQFHSDLAPLAPKVSVTHLINGLLFPNSLTAQTHWPQATIVRSTQANRLAIRVWETRVESIPRVKKSIRRALSLQTGARR